MFIAQAGNGQVKSSALLLGLPSYLPFLLSTHRPLLTPSWLQALDGAAEASSAVQPHPEGHWEEGR